MNDEISPNIDSGDLLNRPVALKRLQFVQALALAKKVAGELSAPQQFLNRDRLTELVHRGINSVNAISNLNNRRRTEFIQQADIQSEEKPDGSIVGIHGNYAIAYVIFPPHSKFSYFLPGSGNSDFDGTGNYFIRAATEKSEGLLSCSSEGQKDSTGIISAFADRSALSKIQHGGIFIDNHTGDLEILDYASLSRRKVQALKEGQTLMEANWYMNSKTAEIVGERKNMLIPRTYNGLGVVHFKDLVDVFFGISNDYFVLQLLEKELSATVPLTDYDDTSVGRIAAICDWVVNYVGGEDWEFVGLEFNRGGTYPRSILSKSAQAGRIQYHHHFAVHTTQF